MQDENLNEKISIGIVDEPNADFKKYVDPNHTYRLV